MRALIYRGPGDLAVEDVPDPEPPRGWVRLRVRRVGICGTDKSFYRGTYLPRKIPIVPGHEIAGIVDQVGEGVQDLKLERVTTEINVTCGECWFCRHGMRTHCPNREALGISLDGGMAEYVLTPTENLHDVEGLTDLQATFVEPLAAVIEMTLMAQPEGENFLVLGAGTIGLLAAQLLSKLGRVIVSARNDSPKAEIVEKLGLEFVPVNELRSARRDTPEGQGFDYVVEATGSMEGLKLAMENVRPRGTIAAKSTHGLPVGLDYTSLVVKEIKLVGSRCGPFNEAIDLLKSGEIVVDELVTSTFPLEEAGEAFDVSMGRDQVKVHLIL